MPDRRSPIARRLPSAIALALACVTAAPQEARGAFLPPQAVALSELRLASRRPVLVTYHDGFPESVLMEVPAVGATPEERARQFLTRFAALYLQDHLDVALVHSRSGLSADEGELVRFAQTFRGLPVYGAEIVVHVSGDTQGPQRVFGTSGRLFVPARTGSATPIEPAIDFSPQITARQAEDAARVAKGSPTARVLGETILMLYDPSLLDQPGAPRLAWRVGLENARSVQYLIDAGDAAVLHEEELTETSAGLSDFDLWLVNAQLSNMSDTHCFLLGGVTAGDEGGMSTSAVQDYESVTAWNAARSTYLMFHDTLGRHSYDDDDAELVVGVHAHLGFPTEPNATAGSWCGIQFSNGWVALDVLAHEFGHLVIDETSDLIGSYAPGSLNESYSDTMAIMVDNNDWTLGEAMTDPNVTKPIRNFQDPAARKCRSAGDPPTGPWPVDCPDTLSELFALPMAIDKGGVHINAGISNKAFYLLANGGTFNGRTVTGIGRTKMGKIAHRTFINLPSTAGFSTLRGHAVAVATFMDLMNQGGITAQDVCSVKNAFAAVELGAGDANCDGIDDSSADTDADALLDDGDFSGVAGDDPCTGGNTTFCDDNCVGHPNPDQADWDGDGDGDICDTDDDQDGVPDAYDACPGWPGTTPNSDGNGLPDCFDPDDDNDLIPDDGDGSGVAGDNPCLPMQVLNCDDNCHFIPNMPQADGNLNGEGDACDPDLDGDGVFGLDDNCPFETNASQADADGDGLGDACDGCPNTYDWSQAYTIPGPFDDGPPQPYQPDSDGDGIPDMCDNLGFGSTGMLNGGQPYGVFNAVRPNGTTSTLQISGPIGGGQKVRLAFPACDTGDPAGVEANERVEVVLGNLPPSLRGWMEDGRGRIVGRFRMNAAATAHGLRFRPRCHERYALRFETTAAFDGHEVFTATASAAVPAGANPWASNAALFSDPPPPLPDQDGDGVPDAADSCPAAPDPTNADADHDGIGDACDAAPGGRVTRVFSGVVASFDDGSGPPFFNGIAPGLPFTGRLVYDTTLPPASEPSAVSRTYAQAPPITPLELSVVVAGIPFSAGSAAPFTVTIENGNGLAGDRFTVGSADVAGRSAATELLSLSLGDPAGAAFAGLAIPAAVDLADFAERLVVMQLDTGSPATSTFMTLAITAMSPPYDAGRLYWLDTAGEAIRRSDLDGSGIVTLVSTNDPIGFEVDPAGGRLYWTECCPGKIRRSAIDGSGAVDLASVAGSPYGIGLDPAGGRLALADIAIPALLRSVGIGGGTAAPLVSVAPNTPYAVAVEPASAKIYWTETGPSPRIRRANLDGSAPETVVAGTAATLHDARGLALDAAAGRMYWTDTGLDRIYRATLDGGGQTLIADAASAGLQDPTGIALDPPRGRIYWADAAQRRIQRARLDGTMVETVLSAADGLSFPHDLFVDPGTDCQPPAAALSLGGAARTPGGLVLTMTDPNPPVSVTGYTIRRTSKPSLPEEAWALLALDVSDADTAAPGIQWIDPSADPSPGEAWYYTAAAWNAGCPLEGPQ